jgi:hypothetical protein
MARTIGKKWRSKVVKLTKEAIRKDLTGDDIDDYVTNNLPEEVLYSWEDAFGEIQRIINDTVMQET